MDQRRIAQKTESGADENRLSTDIGGSSQECAVGHHPPTIRREPHRSTLVWYRDKFLLPTIFAVLVVDQVSKFLVGSWLPLHHSWPENGFIRITHGLNSGTAFGFFPNQTTVLIVASLLAIGFLFYFYRTHLLPVKLLRFGIGLQLGGALGNLIDRLRNGFVVDFIDVGPWPIFNLADSSIVVGITIVVVLTLFIHQNGAKESEDVGVE